MQISEMMAIGGLVFFILIGITGFIGQEPEPETSVVNEESTTWSTID